MNTLRTLSLFAGVAMIGAAARLGAATDSPQSAISRVAQMPNLPQPYSMRNWSQVTRDYLDLVFDFDQHGDHLPLVAWLDSSHKMVSMPSYVGGPSDPEAINFLAAVISGSLVGIDMRSFHGQDWVALGSSFFNADEGVYVNALDGHTGKSFWYDIFPNVLAYQLDALYPDDPARERQAISVATRWQDACKSLGGGAEPSALPNFDHTAFSLTTMQPAEHGWIEPEAAGGIAWLEYMAWVRFKDERFLNTADQAIRSLEDRPDDKSPLYEVLLPYGTLAAARMNAELGRNYSVGKLLNNCFDPHGRPQARPGWGVISDRWNGLDAHGLVGSTTDGEGYAFAMNTFQWAGALVPIARYDTRYAHDIGKWTLNLANAARLFYPCTFDAEHQSSFTWSTAHDGKSAIAYEGIRKWKRGASIASKDYRTTGGTIVDGNCKSTRYRGEEPPDAEVFEEAPDNAVPFEHIWEFDLPAAPDRWLVVAAERIDGGHVGNTFNFSFASSPDGQYTPAFSVLSSGSTEVVELPAALRGKLYLKTASAERTVAGTGRDRLAVDAMAITYRDTIGPFAQGDSVVSFISLLKEATAPIVLYRPDSVTTDLGLYGSSQVGILGGIIRETNVAGILQLNLLKTDYFHAKAYPTYLYYNPNLSTETVEINVGQEPQDMYDAAAGEYLAKSVTNIASFTIAADSARVVIVAPAGGEMRREGTKTLIDDVVVRCHD